MPPIDNPRHERFAQELAKGKSQSEAYALAGYAPSEPNASRLTRNDKVARRVAELQERGAIKVECTLEDIARQLDEDRQLAHKGGQAGAAVAASLGKAKLFGLMIEKSQQELSGAVQVSRIELVGVRPSVGG